MQKTLLKQSLDLSEERLSTSEFRCTELLRQITAMRAGESAANEKQARLSQELNAALAAAAEGQEAHEAVVVQLRDALQIAEQVGSEHSGRATAFSQELLAAQVQLHSAQREVGDLVLQLSIATTKLDLKEAETAQNTQKTQLKDLRSLKNKARSLRLCAGDAKADAGEKDSAYGEVYENKRGSVFYFDESNFEPNYAVKGEQGGCNNDTFTVAGIDEKST